MRIVTLTIGYSIYKEIVCKTGIITMSVEHNPVNDVHECIVVYSYWIIARDNSIIINNDRLPHHTFYCVIFNKQLFPGTEPAITATPALAMKGVLGVSCRECVLGAFRVHYAECASAPDGAAPK